MARISLSVLLFALLALLGISSITTSADQTSCRKYLKTYSTTWSPNDAYNCNYDTGTNTLNCDMTSDKKEEHITYEYQSLDHFLSEAATGVPSYIKMTKNASSSFEYNGNTRTINYAMIKEIIMNGKRILGIKTTGVGSKDPYTSPYLQINQYDSKGRPTQGMINQLMCDTGRMANSFIKNIPVSYQYNDVTRQAVYRVFKYRGTIDRGYVTGCCLPCKEQVTTTTYSYDQLPVGENLSSSEYQEFCK